MSGLPDIEGAHVNPHPDYIALRKACPECAFRTSDPQDLGDYGQRGIRRASDVGRFYCIHRMDGTHHRVCACWAAIHRLPRQTLESRT